MRWTQRHGRQRSPSLPRPANLTPLGVFATACPYHPPWKSPLPGRCLAEIWLLHPHKMHPIQKRGDEPSEEHTERRSELPTNETTGRPTERTPRRTTAGANDPPSDGTHDRASGRIHARPLDRTIELLSGRRGGSTCRVNDRMPERATYLAVAIFPVILDPTP